MLGWVGGLWLGFMVARLMKLIKALALTLNVVLTITSTPTFSIFAIRSEELKSKSWLYRFRALNVEPSFLNVTETGANSFLVENNVFKAEFSGLLRQYYLKVGENRKLIGEDEDSGGAAFYGHHIHVEGKHYWPDGSEVMVLLEKELE